ncbi:MAG: FGGY-family carbohydrate kinase [Defluviitaleaceae bacterium]|nr:FGGY-family carbohydrate kinase [Defluviitaleaceae bacterium]
MYLGIELGSTRIKAVLVDGNHNPVASGSHIWENALVDGVWTYSLEDVWAGISDAVANLAATTSLDKVNAIGISAMMHGYLVFDKAGSQLVPFRTWRNTTTEEAASLLTKAFDFNIPQRWSIAHLYQAVLNKEAHIGDIAFLTTLAGYVHWRLTGEKVIGIGDGSGIFPCTTEGYDTDMMKKFNSLTEHTPWKLNDILPRVKNAGEHAGQLTAEGAALLGGGLQPGVAFCPPEGDAGTGMIATNSVRQRTGNISAGTSVFAMIVLEKPLSRVLMEIDMVTTPTGSPVAMVHCNSCCSDIDAWAGIFGEVLQLFGQKPDMGELFQKLYQISADGDSDCGGLLSYNYLSGEPITGFAEGRPLLVRKPDANFTLANLMASLVYSAIGTLKIGMDILQGENVQVDSLLGHGGFFKTPKVGQAAMAAALGVPVTVMETASEGGAWGIALLAAYMAKKAEGESLEDYLEQKVFANAPGSTIAPDEKSMQGFAKYMEAYTSGLAIEKKAVEKFL